MGNQRHLPNAPIREALVDLRISPSQPCDLSALTEAADAIVADYPNRIEIITGTINVHIGDSSEKRVPTVDKIVNGFRLSSDDGIRTVQFRKDGFTFNRLRPYSTWEEMIDEARRLWDIYRLISNATEVSRVATRFINDLSIPMPIDDLSTYLIEPPKIPEGLPQAMKSFFTRMVVESDEEDAQCVLTLVLEGVTGTKAPVIFDIDVFRASTFEPESDEIWQCLEKFRALKNKIFFQSLKEECLRLYQ